MIAPHLRQRPCSRVWACVVCPRPAVASFVIDGSLLVLCVGCALGFMRALTDPREPKEALQ